MQVQGPTIQTERLLLRVPCLDDLEPYAAFLADPEAARFLGGPLSLQLVWRNLASIIGSWALHGFGMLTFIERSSGRWVGRGGPWSPPEWPGTEVGWAIAPEFQQRGFGTEAARACIDWAFDHLGWTQVVHCIDPANTASIALAQRLGSSVLRRGVEAPLPISDHWDIYGQSREAWFRAK